MPCVVGSTRRRDPNHQPINLLIREGGFIERRGLIDLLRYNLLLRSSDTNVESFCSETAPSCTIFPHLPGSEGQPFLIHAALMDS